MSVVTIDRGFSVSVSVAAVAGLLAISRQATVNAARTTTATARGLTWTTSVGVRSTSLSSARLAPSRREIVGAVGQLLLDGPHGRVPNHESIFTYESRSRAIVATSLVRVNPA